MILLLTSSLFFLVYLFLLLSFQQSVPLCSSRATNFIFFLFPFIYPSSFYAISSSFLLFVGPLIAILHLVVLRVFSFLSNKQWENV